MHHPASTVLWNVGTDLSAALIKHWCHLSGYNTDSHKDLADE